MADTPIRIPDPSLIVLIGAAGAGKSTFAQRWFAPPEILSSDKLRAEIGRGEADQRVSNVAFTLLHERLAARLASGQLTVVDATNLQTSARRALLVRRPSTEFPAVALLFDAEPVAVHTRNASRPGRVVPASVVDRQLAVMRQVSDARLHAEGFGPNAVHRIADPRAVELVRDPG